MSRTLVAAMLGLAGLILACEPDPSVDRDQDTEQLLVDFDFLDQGLRYIAGPTPELLGTLASLPATDHMLTHARLTSRGEFDLSSAEAFVTSVFEPLIRRRGELLPRLESNRAVLERRPRYWRTCRTEVARYLWPRQEPSRLFLTLGYDIGVALPGEASINIAHRYFLEDVEEALYYCVHELHHAGVLSKHPLPLIGEIRTASELADLIRLSLMLEGTAVYAALDLRVRADALEDPDYVAVMRPGLMRRYEDDCFALLADLAAEPDREVLDADWERFWNADRIAYRFGFKVARTIDETLGRERWIQLIGRGPDDYLNAYLDIASSDEP